MNVVRLNKETKKNLLEQLLKRSTNDYGEIEGRVADIFVFFDLDIRKQKKGRRRYL